jgi:hypothetical protein
VENVGDVPRTKYLSALHDGVPDCPTDRLLTVFESDDKFAARARRLAVCVHRADPKLARPRLGDGLLRQTEREWAHADRRA